MCFVVAEVGLWGWGRRTWSEAVAGWESGGVGRAAGGVGVVGGWVVWVVLRGGRVGECFGEVGLELGAARCGWGLGAPRCGRGGG